MPVAGDVIVASHGARAALGGLEYAAGAVACLDAVAGSGVVNTRPSWLSSPGGWGGYFYGSIAVREILGGEELAVVCI